MEMEEERQAEEVLTLELFPRDELETRLRKLCFLVLAAESDKRSYELRLGQEVTLPMGRGPKHRAAALKALALYGVEG
jgi:uncharacterized protein (DUF58 family)